MAETRVTDTHAHMGTTAERTAMSTTGLPHGSTWHDTDTQRLYKWDGTSWNLT